MKMYICESKDICPVVKTNMAICDHESPHVHAGTCDSKCDLGEGIIGSRCKNMETKWDE
jgi:hypothetical protein